MTDQLEIKIHPAPISITVDAASFGKLFAGMSDDDQVEVFRSMVEHMEPHRIQWDYIAIKLQEPGNEALRMELLSVFAWDGSE